MSRSRGVSSFLEQLTDRRLMMAIRPSLRRSLRMLARHPELALDPEVVVYLAHICNYLAKAWDERFYQHKALLVDIACQMNPDRSGWGYNNIVYIDTDQGQVSFHLFEDIDVDWSYYKEWSGIPNQHRSVQMLDRAIRSAIAKRRPLLIGDGPGARLVKQALEVRCE